MSARDVLETDINPVVPNAVARQHIDAFRDQVLTEMAADVRAISKAKGWSLWAADYMDPNVEFTDVGMPSTGQIVAELRRADRAAVLREGAAAIEADDRCHRPYHRAHYADLLRRLADEAEGKPTAEQKDTQTSSQPVWAGFTAREEIIGNLIAAGYNEAAAAELMKRADHEPRDSDPDPDSRETLGGGHALIVEYGDCVAHGSCQCGKRLGMTTPDASLDTFVKPWERHTMTEVSG